MRSTALLLGLGLLVSCGREGNWRSRPASSRSSLPVGAPAGSASFWDDALGTFIATPSGENGVLVAYGRDSASSGTIEVELFSHEGRATHAAMNLRAHQQSCPWKWSGVLSGPEGLPSAATWALALTPGVGTAVSIDAASELLPRDSAALVAAIMERAGTLVDDSVSAPFRGLPFVVRDAFLIPFDDGGEVVVASVLRTLNVESNPRAEITSLVAEHGKEHPDDWQIGFAQRVAGSEDRVDSADLLAAFRLRNDLLELAFAREEDEGPELEIAERTARGVWRVRWLSSALPCAR